MMPDKRKTKDDGDKAIIADSRLKKTSSLSDKPVLRAREVGDKPVFTDAMFNFVPGSCFEIGAALAILDNPGHAGVLVDEHARRFSAIMDAIYQTDVGNREMVVDAKTPEVKITLKKYFDKKILSELSPGSDQIGRCQDMSLKDRWLQGAGSKWLSQQVRISSESPEYKYTNMLTKMRTLSAAGSVLSELIDKDTEIAEALLGKDRITLNKRKSQIKKQIKHADFDNPVTRARTEKTPLVEGQALTSFTGVNVKTVEATDLPRGLGFGKVWHERGMTVLPIKATQTPQEQEDAERARMDVVAKYTLLEKTSGGRQGVPRVGQDIKDFERPGLLGESSQDLIPEEFLASGLIDQLRNHRFEHGSGLNRWQLTGRYPRESWEQSMPAAGAHSGGTVNIFSAINCLGDDSIFGKPEALHVGLLATSFMNFGGYHSVVETFPIAQAIAADSTFAVHVGAEQRGLYSDIRDIVAKNGDPHATNIVDRYLNAYAQCLAAIPSTSNPTNTTVASEMKRQLEALKCEDKKPDADHTHKP